MRMAKLWAPRVFVQKRWGGHLECYRIILTLRSLRQYCLFDWTRTRFHVGKPAYWRVRLAALTLIERHREYGGFLNDGRL